MFLVYVNSSQLTTRVEYFAIIRSRLIAECFVFIFYFNATAADMKKFRVSAYSRINTVLLYFLVSLLDIPWSTVVDSAVDKWRCRFQIILWKV